MDMPDRKYLSALELQTLLGTDLGPMDNLIVQIGISCGLRASEMVNIKLNNIYPEGMKIWDEKKDEYRTVVIDGWLMFEITEYVVDHYENLHGVRSRDRKLFNFSAKTLNRKVKRWFSDLEIRAPARWHTFRHSYIRIMLDRLGDKAIQFICLQTGDKPATILTYYAEPSMDDRIKIANKLRTYIGEFTGEFDYDPPISDMIDPDPGVKR